MRKTIEEMLASDPFRPFTILLTSGDRYVVTNPQLVARGETILYFAHAGTDRLDHLRMNQIAALELLDSAA